MSQLGQMLNVQLATYIDLYLQLKQAHWNCKGANFIGLHELFDDAAGQVQGWYDTIAERARALGDEACGVIEDVSERSQLKPYTLSVADSSAHVKAIVGALEKASESAQEGIKVSLAMDDQATADVFIEITRGTDKLRFLIGAHV